MADQSEKPEEKEIKIPVFTVLKKGSILKNIFLNTPPPEPKSSTGSGGDGDTSDPEADPILIGRHPDCHIVLDHPSISRFHLEIRAKPSLQKLSVIDRSSVHGTWVSGCKIQPHVSIDLVEGDMVRLGASTRVYRLQWVPLSRAFEMENPLSVLLEEKEETHQDENPTPVITDSNELWPALVPSAPPMSEFLNPSSPGEVFSSPLAGENQSPIRMELEEKVSLVRTLKSVSTSSPREEQNINPEDFSADEVLLSERENQSPLRSEKRAMSSSLLSRRSKSVSFLRINMGRSKEGMVGTSFDTEMEAVVQKENAIDFEGGEREQTLCKVLFSNSDGNEEDEKTFATDKENLTPETSLAQKLKRSHIYLQRSSSNAMASLNVAESSLDQKSSKSHTELQRSSSNTITVLDFEDEMFQSDKENWTPEVHRDLKSKKPISENHVTEREEDAFASDKENLTPYVSGALKSREPSANNHYGVEREEDDTFPSDKENLTPVASSAPKSRKFASDKENSTPDVSGALKSREPLAKNHDRVEREEEDTFPSDKENLTPAVSGAPKSRKPLAKKHAGIERDMIRKRVERVPFQSLFENNNPGNSNSSNHAQRRLEKGDSTSVNSTSRSNSVNHVQRTVDKGKSTLDISVDEVRPKVGEEKKWNIVVDTDCFLDEDSRRSIQLLEGLKGTHLIIPRMVIRELDYLKRRESLFRKATKASSVLQWIEECMVKASWWIHVQSSLETIPVAPTPPASPHSSNELGIGALNSMPFSCGSLMEIASPTSGDHILDCALLFKRIRNDGRIILLTNNVTLKIKAMAEGLLCETPKEFRESLVNPYSKRFLWVDSSPRGSTWSCSDEVGLIENYYHQCPTKRKTAKASEGAKGLKLILLHNSHYARTNSVSMF